MATLTDKATKLKKQINRQIENQPFFVKAAAGDELLLVSHLASLVEEIAQQLEGGSDDSQK